MRIISPFHDYYDSAMGLGAADDSLFLRRSEAIPVPHGHDYEVWTHPFKRLIDRSVDAQIGPFGFYTVGHRGREILAEPRLVMLAGRLYPFMALRDVRATSDDSTVAWSTEEVSTWLKARGFQLKSKASSWSLDRKTDADRAKAWFALRDEDATAVMAQAQVALAVIVNHRQRWSASHGVDLILNPRLADYGMAKQVDPWTAYQELTMFVEGVLRHPDPVTVPITDKDRLMQHGFDRWSFKKMPSTAASSAPASGLKKPGR